MGAYEPSVLRLLETAAEALEEARYRPDLDSHARQNLVEAQGLLDFAILRQKESYA